MAFDHFHRWGFPQRQKEFEGRRAVDVQTCTECGRQRISPVQFGPEAQSLQLHASAKSSLAEKEATL